jgi:protein ImuA
MKWVTAYCKTLQVQDKTDETLSLRETGFSQAISAAAVHELLFDPSAGELPPLFPALTAARAGMEKTAAKSLIWIDPAGTFYPPAAMGSSITSGRLDVVRPTQADLTWATVECLRCKQVGAVVALLMHRLTRVEVRRLQLAAELGGTVGLLLRPNLAGANIYSAATRWRVSPAPGERTIQRWHIRQIHGHGRRLSFFLEKNRATGQTNFVSPPAPLVHHPLRSATS